jgi:hypothetical protein
VEPGAEAGAAALGGVDRSLGPQDVGVAPPQRPGQGEAGDGGEGPLAPDPGRRRPHTAAGDRAEIGTSFWTALEPPDVDEIVDDCFDAIYPLAELRGDPAPKRIRHR